ncbi:hypothetical protein BC938DRAFT_479659 [Jimgerdemannia flammicorona]|uniref:Stn1 C-terminal domain-containing protein n=1 Tax=Jimgerdemannia flammicorona TaxID=994334 RepID=A0A433QKE7_9FUNG|nr:hypothetical protein BC938DRAFT_479659 [Jimgerdemannia flammicorona]
MPPQRNVATPNRQHISSVFQHGIGSLVKEGLLIVKDVERDMYEVVRDELNLGPVLMRIIREATDNRILKPGGVQLDYILDMLSITEPFHKIPRQVAMKTLRWLESNSDIYQIGLREYKCL